MKEALYWEKKTGKVVQCHLCPRQCIIKEDNFGVCRVRKNVEGRLYSLVYGRAVSAAVDPIEKKPLYHFLPGSSVYSIGTVGCNLACEHCQNWKTSQAFPGGFPDVELMPKQVVEEAIENGCESIAYTYNEPTIFFEYVLDTAKIAKKKGLKNIIVSNGFINQEPLLEWCKVIDAANIDLKSFDDKFYRKVTTAWLEPVLETIKTLHKKKVWLEITNLIIPGLNDDMEKIDEMCRWIKENADCPVHFTGFYPAYKLNHIPSTTPDVLLRARKIGLDNGLRYVYVGNVSSEKEGDTFCPKCNGLLIKRDWFESLQNNIKKGKCSKCGEKISGVWE